MATISYTKTEIAHRIAAMEAAEKEGRIKNSTRAVLEKFRNMAAVLAGEHRAGMDLVKTGGNGRRVVDYRA